MSYIVASDLDQDGAVDLAVASESAQAVLVLWNAGDGDFSTTTYRALGQSPYSMAASDLDGDGYADLITANASGNTLSLLSNGGNRTFSLERRIEAPQAPGEPQHKRLDPPVQAARPSTAPGKRNTGADRAFVLGPAGSGATSVVT